jgi:flagellar biogenesis protein FliO
VTASGHNWIRHAQSAFGRSPCLRNPWLALALAAVLVAAVAAWAQEGEAAAGGAESAATSAGGPAAGTTTASPPPSPAVRKAEQERIEREKGYRVAVPTPEEAAAAKGTKREKNIVVSLIEVFLKLGVVVGLLYGTLWLIRRMRQEPSLRWGGEGRDLVTVLESTRLTPDKSLHVVSVGGRVLLLASGPQGVALLSEFAEGEFSDALDRRAPSGGGFSSELEQVETGYATYGAAEDAPAPSGSGEAESATATAREAVRRALDSLRSTRRGGRA